MQNKSSVNWMSSSVLHRDLAGLYDRLAPDYDRLHRRWLRYAGGEAQAALDAAVRVLITPNTNMLDAGCGTGALARTLDAEGVSPACVTLLDPSDAMLARCSDLSARQVRGRVEALPFMNGEFDIVTCAWALETTPYPEVALRELCRVVRPGGFLCVAYCAEIPARDPAAWLMRQAVKQKRTGRFLNARYVISTIKSQHGFEVRSIPCRGPVAALIARRVATTDEKTNPDVPCELSAVD